MGELKIGEIIKELRGDKGISQEVLADRCGISMQAVSKWENGQSCPDITFLPLLAEYFHVTVDYLLTGVKGEASGPCGTADAEDARIADAVGDRAEEDVLYIVQYRNGKVLHKEQWDKDREENGEDAVRICFAEEFAGLRQELRMEVWGNADINAEHAVMAVYAGGNVNCGTVEGDVQAGGDVNCDKVEGNAQAGGDVNCGAVEGNVAAGVDVNCSKIAGDVSAGCSVKCNKIGGNVTTGVGIGYETPDAPDPGHFSDTP